MIAICSSYICHWPGKMTAAVHIRRQWQEEGAGGYVREALEEAECFPVRRDNKGKEHWYYEDAYGAGRTYGGNRTHEGIDIMASNDQPGYFVVQSMTDGVIENIGWLELGGYRIGIRGDSGLYYYYAHLDSYAPDLKKGDRVRAGQPLGYMGDTGYGQEGTRGKFAVHLHFGIYYNRKEKTLSQQEESVNPYYLLQYLEHGMIP